MRPENVNNIFDSIMKAGTNRQNKIQLSQLKREKIELSNECGSCSEWMTSNCDRERSHKVSCSEKICEDFKIQSWAVDIIENKEVEITNLNNIIFNL